MKFVLRLTWTQTSKYSIMVVVDWFSKMTHFIPRKRIYDVVNVANLFFDMAVNYHGIHMAMSIDLVPLSWRRIIWH